MKFSTKKVFQICFIYGLIVAIANLCGQIIPALLQSPEIRSPYMDSWMNFLTDYKWVTNISGYSTFVLPTVLCLVYPFQKKDQIEQRLINLPFAYSTIGITGWMLYFVEEIFFLFLARSLGYEIEVRKIFFSSLMYIILECTITFTLSYFLLDFCHKKFFFPKYYPNGEFHGMKGLRHLSIRFLFVVNYISVTFFPITFAFVAFCSVLDRNGIVLEKNIISMLGIIFIIGIIISITFLNTIQKPLNLLNDRIKKLQKGDLTSKVVLLSNDDFGELSESFNEMTEGIFQRNRKIEEIQNSVIESMAIAVEGKDSNTGGHIKRTSDCVRVFVDKLKTMDVYNKISSDFYNSVIISAPMHDLGKLYIDDKVLKKNGKFTDEEYEEMKKHSSEGAKVVADILKKHDNEELKKVAENIAHYHHEKWNGTGYPEKLKESQIPLEARIMALADVFDALVSKRCYKDSFSFEKSFGIIKESLGSHFDPELGAIFIACRPELEQLYSANSHNS